MMKTGSVGHDHLAETSPQPRRESTRRIQGAAKRKTRDPHQAAAVASASTSRWSRNGQHRTRMTVCRQLHSRHDITSNHRSSAERRRSRRSTRTLRTAQSSTDRTHLTNALIEEAGSVLWDSGPKTTSSLDKLMVTLLKDRFGGAAQSDKYKMEL